jgi:hypothetical protein
MREPTTVRDLTHEKWGVYLWVYFCFSKPVNQAVRVAAEIVENLEAALERFRKVAASLQPPTAK